LVPRITIAALAALGLLAGVVPASATQSASDPNYLPLPVAQRHEIASVSPQTFAAIGAGPHGRHRNVPPRLVSARKLTLHGKPELAYVVADFCPYCAAENWSVAVALSRFGHLHGLTTLSSASDDVYPSTKTISFRYAHYRSRYLAYRAYVNEDANRRQLQPVPRKVRRTWLHYTFGVYPFLDFGGKAIVDGASFSPGVLAHLTRAEIAGDLSHRTSPVAKAINGSANQLTAAICVMTKNTPKRICRSKTIASIERSLPTHH
jgi:hypothetical protein